MKFNVPCRLAEVWSEGRTVTICMFSKRNHSNYFVYRGQQLRSSIKFALWRGVGPMCCRGDRQAPLYTFLKGKKGELQWPWPFVALGCPRLPSVALAHCAQVGEGHQVELCEIPGGRSPSSPSLSARTSEPSLRTDRASRLPALDPSRPVGLSACLRSVSPVVRPWYVASRGANLLRGRDCEAFVDFGDDFLQFSVAASRSTNNHL